MTVILGRTNCEKEAPADDCAVHKEPGFAKVNTLDNKNLTLVFKKKNLTHKQHQLC